MNGPVAVASFHLGSGFGGVVYALLQSQLRPGESLVECLTSGDEELRCRPLLELLERSPAPSAIIGIAIRPAPDVIAAVRARSIPLVLIDEEAEGVSSVACDNLAGGLLAGRHLARLGRKSMAVVCGRRSVRGGQNAALRVQGFERGLTEAGLPFGEANVLEVADYSRKDGTKAMLELLERRPAIDAIFCAAGDLCATGMLSAARERHVRVPEQIAVVGFDDHPLSGICQPPMTTIRQPLERIAVEAYRLATSDPAEVHARPQRMRFEPELIVRRSA